MLAEAGQEYTQAAITSLKESIIDVSYRKGFRIRFSILVKY
jgi:hypothetical protein